MNDERLAHTLGTGLNSTSVLIAGPDENRFLENLILKKTGGRIKNLRVETVDGRMIISGRAMTFYAWQLALTVVRESPEFTELNGRSIELDIQVCGKG